MTDEQPRDSRFQHGLDTYDVMTGNMFGNQLSPGLADLGRDFPFLVNAAMSFAIGDVWGRTEIDHKSREFAMIAALGALGAGGYVQLRQHAEYALILGATADELRELVYLTTVSAGFPRALNMAAEIKVVLDQAGVGPAGVEPFVAEEDRQERGLMKLAALEGTDHLELAKQGSLGPLSADYPFLVESTLAYALGDVWTRTALDPRLRQISMIAALGAMGDAWPQMRVHVGHALRMGVSKALLKEIIYLIVVAAGFPVAINAAVEMRKVFDEAGV